MNFLDLPKEVIFHNILPKLSLNDNLRLRRVSKGTKELADSYIRLHSIPPRLIDIGSHGSVYLDWSSFLRNEADDNLDSNIYLKVRDVTTLLRPGAREFIRKYGYRVVSLDVYHFEIPIISPEAIIFLESLANLRQLKINTIEVRKLDPHAPSTSAAALSAQNGQSLEVYVPTTFRTLKRLDVHRHEQGNGLTSIGWPPPPQLLTVLQTIWKFISDCSSNLEYLTIPRVNYTVARASQGGPFSWITQLLVKRHQENPNEPNLRFINMKHFPEEDDTNPSAANFLRLTSLAYLHRVKLLNVHGRLIEGIMTLEIRDPREDPTEAPRNVGAVVASLWNMESWNFVLNMPTLEKISIDGTTFNCRMKREHVTYYPPAEMPNLKSLRFVVDSPRMFGDNSVFTPENLYRFFFQPRHARVKMESLEMHFPQRFSSIFFNAEMLQAPRVRDIISSCPNLTRLTIKHWPGSNRAISTFWQGLKHLEEVRFGSCKNLGNAAFVGEDLEEPLFLKAQKLRCLTLESLDDMPKITDTLFRKVLCHSKLRELHLRCDIMKPARSITISGIEALLTGEFAKSIQRFPLHHDLILDGVTTIDLKKLESKFRSGNMM